jgi:hypothetical protein
MKKKMCVENIALLDELGARVKQRCECMEQADAGTGNLERAIANGEDAIQAKHVSNYGEFVSGWIDKHELEKTQIYDHILLAKNKERIRREGCKTIRQALKLLRAPKAKKPKEVEPEGETEVETEIETKAVVDLAAVVEFFNQDPFRRVDEFLADARLTTATRLAWSARVPVLQKKMQAELRAQKKPGHAKSGKPPTEAQIAETTAIESDNKVINLAFRRGLLQPAIH